MHRLVRAALALALCLPLSGCLGTIVTAPVAGGRSYEATDAHLILAPTAIDARDCPNGL